MTAARLDKSEMHGWSATQLAHEIGQRRVSSLEATTHVIARANRLEPRLHAFATRDAEGALIQARAADEALARGAPIGPLHGVPVALKENIAVQGLPCSGGMPWMAGNSSPRDATVVSRLRAAGAIVLGTMQMSEGGWSAHHPSSTAPVNPWNAAYSPSGSSSGPGVATAAGLCYAALGTDTGGSVRQPAAASGIYGLKPTWGRVSCHGILPMSPSLDHVGLMARSAADIATLLEILGGADGHDPASEPFHQEQFRHRPDHGSTVRIGVPAGLAEAGVDGAVLEAIRTVTAILQKGCPTDAGLSALHLADAATAWLPLCAPDVYQVHAYAWPSHGGSYGPALDALVRAGRDMPASKRLEACKQRQRFAQAMTAAFSEVDVLLLPVTAAGPALLDATFRRGSDPVNIVPALTYTAPFNLSGHPALTLPCFRNADGMPVGLQMVTRHGAEHLLLGLALHCERELGPVRVPTDAATHAEAATSQSARDAKRHAPAPDIISDSP